MRPAHAANMLATSCAAHEGEVHTRVDVRQREGLVLACHAGQERHQIIRDMRAPEIKENDLFAHARLAYLAMIAAVRG